MRFPRCRIMRIGRRSFWLLLSAAIAAATTGVNAVAAEHFETLATSASAPVKLGAGPVAVKLVPPAAGKALSARVATVGEPQIHLVARGLAPTSAGDDLPIYLGLPRASLRSQRHLLCWLAEFLQRGGSGRPIRVSSDDVTALFDAAVAQSLGDNTTVTAFRPARPASAPSRHRRAALVEQ